MHNIQDNLGVYMGLLHSHHQNHPPWQSAQMLHTFLHLLSHSLYSSNISANHLMSNLRMLVSLLQHVNNLGAVLT